MARPRKPWFRKSNKRWYVEFQGKQVNLGPDKKEAHQRFHQMMAQPEPKRRPPRTARISLPELVDHFLEWVERNRAGETYEWYRYRLERLCRKLPDAEANQLRPYHIEEWVNEYDLSVTSRRNYFRSAKRCFSWGKKQGVLSSNPLEDLEVPKAENRDVSLTVSEFDDVMSYVRNQQLADLINVTWLTGCRPQESLIVEARHVDVGNQRWVFDKAESKGKKISRVVYMTDEAMDIVRRLMLQNPDGPLFRNARGRVWTTDAVNCAFGAIQVRMGQVAMAELELTVSEKEINALVSKLCPTRRSTGVAVEKTVAELRCEAKQKLTKKLAAEHAPRYSLYSLRHSFATNALQKGVDSLTVAVLLGHKDPSTLARVYQHLNQNPSHLLEQARRAAG